MLKIQNYHTPLNLLDTLKLNGSAVATKKLAVATATGSALPTSSFGEELARVKEVHFSKHATQRMQSRGIEMTPEKMSELSGAIDKAAEKGARETLILTHDAAFVVSPSSRTVISAFDRNNLREGVFTAIDSAVIL